jgi:lipopolysaccharide/colanic/teichoic acid biosynthesis glycosyltransferase
MVEEGTMQCDASLTTADFEEAQAEYLDEAEELGEAASAFPMPLWKRTMDVFVACCALIVFLPLMLCAALVIKLVSRGPIFFTQERAGFRGRSFTIWKFRTLHESTDSQRHRQYVTELLQSDGTLKKINHRGNMIPFGQLMRALGIDELPQLLNVLKGDMSIVGPRPDVIPFENYAPGERKRFDVLPGITGLWQVSGKNATTFDEMIQLDLKYVHGQSLWLDLKILLLTLPAIIAQLKDSI